MTNSFDPKAPRSARKKHRREPATIDLKATVIDPGQPADAGRPAERTETETERLVTEAMSEPEPARDAGATGPAGAQPAADTVPTVQPEAEEVPAVHPEAASGRPPGTVAEPPPEAPAGPLPEAALERQPDETPEPLAGPVSEPQPEALAAGEPPAEPPPRADEPLRRPEEPPRRGSAGALVGAGLLGGLVGAGLVYGLQVWQEQSGGGDPRLAQLQQRVSALGQPVDTQGLDRRMTALEQHLQAVQNTADQAARQAQDALNRPAPEASQASSEAASSQGDAAKNAAALNDLSGRLSALEGQVQTQAQGLQQATAAVQSLQQPVQDTQQAVQSLQQTVQGVQQSAQGAQQSVQGLQQTVQDLQQKAQDLPQAVQSVQQSVQSVQQAVQAIDGRVSQNDQRLGTLSQQLAQQMARGPDEATLAALRLSLAQRLNEALRQGSPYGQTLEALKQVEPDAGDRLAPLDAFAQKGAPTAADLARSFRQASAGILRGERPASGDWTDRLQRMVDRLVTVRPVNAPDMTGVPGLVGRIEQALQQGDVREALSVWQTLPEPARQSTRDWSRQAEAKVQADAAAEAVANDALAALNRTKQQ